MYYIDTLFTVAFSLYGFLANLSSSVIIQYPTFTMAEYKYSIDLVKF